MAEDSGENYYLSLNQNPIRFEPIGKMTNVFFDDCNNQVFAVHSGGATGVVVKGLDDRHCINFRMDDRGDVISIKFSKDMQILAIQRSPKSVEFRNFEGGHIEAMEYSQSCKGKSTRILGFNWVHKHEILLVTDHGLEYYQVIHEKHMLKMLKAYSVTVNWFVWLAESAVLLLSAGVLGNILHPFHFKHGIMVKMAKFEVDLPSMPKPPKLSLIERDVTMATIYGHLYIIVLRNQQKASSTTGAEIVLYQLHKESPAKKTDVLRLDMSGRFAINVVDNLLVVHHQASKTSILFDIGLAGESDGYITYHHPVLSPLPIKPFTLHLPVVPGSSQTSSTQDYCCELYSTHWIVFQPNIIIDAKLGCLWKVELKMDPLITMIPDKVLNIYGKSKSILYLQMPWRRGHQQGRLLDFLLLRDDSKPVILHVCRRMLVPDQQSSLLTIARIFDKLNCVYWNYHEAEAHAMGFETIPSAKDLSRWRMRVVIDQPDMYTHVFSVFEENEDIDSKFMVAVLVEYIRSLNQFQIPVQHYLYEIMINSLVQTNSFYQLHQFLQYHVFSDSKPLACLMLSLESIYPPAHQLALDMLKRLSTANEEIVEVLLSKQQLLPALRFLRSVGAVDSAPARKFLEAAKLAQDPMLFYTVFKFFEQRNIKLRQTPKFTPGEHCEDHVKTFEEYFGTEALASLSA